MLYLDEVGVACAGGMTVGNGADGIEHADAHTGSSEAEMEIAILPVTKFCTEAADGAQTLSAVEAANSANDVEDHVCGRGGVPIGVVTAAPSQDNLASGFIHPVQLTEDYIGVADGSTGPHAGDEIELKGVIRVMEMDPWAGGGCDETVKAAPRPSIRTRSQFIGARSCASRPPKTRARRPRWDCECR